MSNPEVRAHVRRRLAGSGLALLATLSFAVPLAAQAPTGQPSGALSPLAAAGAIPSALQPNLATPEVPDNYEIGVNDLLDVFVYQMPEMTNQVRVDTSGNVRLPLLRRPIAAAGATAPTLAIRVERALVSAGLARRPLVQVVVRQVESRPIVVVGAVKYPTVIQAARPMRLAEILARAGGLGSNSGSSVLLTSGPESHRVTQRIDLATLLSTSGSGNDPLLTGDDLVRVLPARLIYITGALNKPGAFPLQTGEPITVLKALALAQGFNATESPDKKHAEIIRSEASGARVVLPINLDRILKHKDPNPTLMAGDLLYVPESGHGRLMQVMMGDLGQAAVIAFGYNATHIF